MKGGIKSFEDWKEMVHPKIKDGPLWQFQVYQKALFAFDLAWEDCDLLLQDKRGETVARQLIRCVGSISANIEEGYGRGYGQDYAYRLRIAMGEAREAQGWYWRSHQLLSQPVLDHRINLHDEVIAMLAPIIQKQRQTGKKR